MQPHRTLLTALAAFLLTACAALDPDPAVGPATLHLDDTRLELEVTACTMVGGRLLETVPEGGAEVTMVAEGTDEGGDPVRVTARRGTDVIAPHRFELLEISRGEVSERLEVLVVLRGYDREHGTWTQIDADAPGARRTVDGGLIEIDGAHLTTRAARTHTPEGGVVEVRLDAWCPPELERDPGLA